MEGIRFTSVCLYIWVSLVLMHGDPVEGNCRQIVRYITHSMGLHSRIRPNIQGEWTSPRCEVRPGPKFVTRYIRIFRNSTWLGRYHHYSDYHCNKPSFTLLIKGFFKMGQESSALKGATSTSFNFSLIELHPHTSQVEREILSAARKSCPNTLRNINRDPGIGVYIVQNQAFNRRTCRSKFGISNYELSLVKLDTRKGKSSKEDVLYFAEIPTGRNRRRYTPKSYQLPLKRYNAPNCSVCMQIRGSTPLHPQTFAKVRPRPVMLNDAWGSSTCETRPGSFLTRYMLFHNKKRLWEGYFNYFSDPYCKKLTFTLYGKGHFTGGIRSTVVRGGENYVFTVTEASITPYAKGTTRTLNSVSRNDECGKDGEWQTGVAQDITQSKGCRIFGINLPHTEYDLLKMDINEHGDRELYVGQRPSDGSSPSSPSRRPTSYQIPMVECSSFKFNFIPPTPEPTTKPSTRYPKPEIINPILTVPTLKRDGDKTTPKQGGKTSKGTKGSSTDGGTVRKQAAAGARINLSTLYTIVVLATLTRLL
ncbi:hypothetical protein QZH41_018218 [Actinostola sp. cb2023]|nr:hypothetical protein QZH41_018218 [Actinostola sp. cb2023]